MLYNTGFATINVHRYIKIDSISTFQHSFLHSASQKKVRCTIDSLYYYLLWQFICKITSQLLLILTHKVICLCSLIISLYIKLLLCMGRGIGVLFAKFFPAKAFFPFPKILFPSEDTALVTPNCDL